MKFKILLACGLVFCSGHLVGSQGQCDSDAEMFGFAMLTVVDLCSIPTPQVETKLAASFACYDEAPGKNLFIACQTEIFGGSLNIVENAVFSCRRSFTLPFYAYCLSQKFNEAGLDVKAAVKTIYACQTNALEATWW